MAEACIKTNWEQDAHFLQKNGESLFPVIYNIKDEYDAFVHIVTTIFGFLSDLAEINDSIRK